MTQERLRIAVQKSGRLSDDSFGLLRSAGAKIQASKRDLFYSVTNMPIDLLLVRDDDITGFVSQGVADLGIVGLNEYDECRLSHDNITSKILMKLGFSRCTLKIAVPDAMEISGPEDLNGLTIATSYPSILQGYLDDNNVNATIVEMSGAIEVAPRLEIADIICDLVSTGGTLKANNLKPVATVHESEAVLLQSKTPLSDTKQAIADSLLPRFDGIKASKETKYVMLNAPVSALEKITSLLPGSEAPTIIPLAASDDMVAVHAVCRENVFWTTLEDLKKAGASSILIIPIEKMMA